MRVYLVELCLFTASFVQAQLPSEGLVCFLPFNGSLHDSSGLGNHALASGSSFCPDRFLAPASALELHGGTDSLRIPVPGFTPLTGDFTISFWLKTSSPEAMNILSLKDAPDDTIQNFELQLNSTYRSQTILELYYASFTYWNGSGIGPDRLVEGAVGQYYNGTWQHYALRRSGDSLQFWHDRYMLVETLFDGPLGDDGELVVSAAPLRFEGMIDDVALYDRALSLAEMTRLHHDRAPLELRSPAATDAYVQGDTALVLWRWDPDLVSDSVDLDFRVNNGPWQPTGHNQLVDWTPYRFVVDFPIGSTVEIRLRDHLDTSIAVSSGAFLVSEYRWELMTEDLPFTDRDGSGLVTLNDRLWLIGGWNPPFHEPTYTNSEVWSSADGITWIQHGEAPWPGRHCSGWLEHDDALWVIGGDVQSGNLRDVWRSEDGINWMNVLDTIPNFSPLRNSHMTASLDGHLFNFGGQPAAYVPENLAQVWRSMDGSIWEQLPDAPWKPRGMVLNSCVDDEGALWLLGGGRLNDRRCYNDVWKTNNGSDWELVSAAAPWAPRYWHNVAWFDDKMWVVCGVVDQTDNDETWYSEDGLVWHELKNPRYAARHAASLTEFNGALWHMAGIHSGDVWRLRNVTNTTRINSPTRSESILIHPNPTSDQVLVNADLTHATAYSSSGIRIPLPWIGNVLSLAGLPSGVYVLQLELRDGTCITQRIIKL